MPVENPERPIRSIYYLLAGMFVFSIQDVIIKFISAAYPVHEIVFIRSCVAIFPLLLIARLEGGIGLLRTRRYAGHIVRSFFMFAAYLCFYLSLSALPIAETVSIFFSAPIFITLFSVLFLGEKATPRAWVAVCAGFLGVVLMLKPGAGILDPAAILAVLTAVFYAAGSILTRRLGKTEKGVSMAFSVTVMYIVYAGILTLLLNGSAVEDHSHPSLAFLLRAWRLPSGGDMIIFLVLGLIAATGFYFLSQAYRLAQPSSIAPFEYFAVPLSVIWGYLFWNDRLGYQSISGMILIVGAGLYMFGGKKGLTRQHVISLFKPKVRR